jgi:hypothetical protein
MAPRHGIKERMHMIKSDYHLDWRPGRIYIPAMNFTGLIGAAGVSVGANTGACVTQEISTFGLVAPMMDTAGDVLDHNLHLPYDVDRNKPIKFRVHWTSGSSTTDDTILWKVFYLAIVPDSTTIAAASTALGTVIATDNVIGAYTWQVTSYGAIPAGTLAPNVEALTLQVEMDAFAAGLTEDKFLLGLEMLYTPKRFRGVDGMKHEASLPTYMLGNGYGG